MAARRLTSTGVGLQAVHDEDVARIAESSWERMLRLDVATPAAARIAEICGQFHSVERDPKPKPSGRRWNFEKRGTRIAEIGESRVSVDFEPLRHLCKSLPRDTAFTFDRPRSLARVKGYSLGTGRLTLAEKEESKRLRPFMLREVPKTRSDCADGPRPCNVMRCRYNLYVTVNPDTGSIKLNFPNMLPGELEYTCSLDAADQGGMTLERVGQLTGLGLERTRQVEASALKNFLEGLPPEAREAFRDYLRDRAGE